MYTNHKEYENNEKSNDEIYQLAKNQALAKLLKKKNRSKNSLFFFFDSLSNLESFAMSIAKHLRWFTSLTVTSAGRNA